MGRAVTILLVLALAMTCFFCIGDCQINENFPTQPGGLYLKKSKFGATETINRLENSLRLRKFKIMARVSHHINAESVNMTLRPTELLIFGNPAVGTRLMQSAQSLGIDLPMKALAYEDEDSNTWLIYNEPLYLTWRHSVTDKRQVVKKMTEALDQFTDEAIKDQPTTES